MQELSNERELLSLDLSDRAVTINKLLEDNQYLNERLNMAQKEAKKLIEIAAQNDDLEDYDEEPIRENNVYF